jgi:molybdopterin converting factor subunit 1
MLCESPRVKASFPKSHRLDLKSARHFLYYRVTTETIVITVRFFASARDVSKLSETRIELPVTSVADDVLTHLVTQYPAMKALRSFIRLAVNEVYVHPNFRLHNGDDVAIIPPVSGG